MIRILTASLTVVALIGAFVPASAQQYPDRPITLVVPLPPGGTNDIMARIIGERMTKTLGQQIVVENRAAGGSGTVATRQVARATPDGYTILLSYTTTFATGPSMYKNAGYDVRKDFAPIGLIAVSPSLVLANKDFPVKNIPELLAHIRKTNEPFQYGAPGVGSVQSSCGRDVRARGQGQADGDPLQGLEPADDRPDRRPHQDRLQPDPGVARRDRGRTHPRARRDDRQTVEPTAGCGHAGGTGPARIRRVAALRPLRTGRHAARDRRAAEQGAQRSARRRRGDQAHPARRRGAEPITPQQYAADIDDEETSWSAVVKDLGMVGN